MMGLPCGEEIMIVGRTMWTQCTSVTDGRTDEQTDRITITKTDKMLMRAATVVEILQDLFYVLLHVLFYL